MIAVSVRVMGGDGPVMEELSSAVVTSERKGSPLGERATRRDSDDAM